MTRGRPPGTVTAVDLEGTRNARCSELEQIFKHVTTDEFACRARCNDGWEVG